MAVDKYRCQKQYNNGHNWATERKDRLAKYDFAGECFFLNCNCNSDP